MRAPILRLVLAAGLLIPSLPAAATPATGEGLVFRIEPGFAMWRLSAKTIESQVGARAGEVPTLLVGETKNAFALTLGIGYDIKGQVTLGLELTGTGWNLGKSTRGGAGFTSFTVAWHPAQLFLADKGPRPWDASVFFGVGYGVVGEDRALRGLSMTVGVRAEAYLAPWISLGLTLRWEPLMYGRYVINWNAGQGINLPKGSGGTTFVPSATIALHAPVGEK